MAEPIELKIGQVWLLDGFFTASPVEIVALGPEWVLVTGLGFLRPTAIARPAFSSAKLTRPKHELWVNVYRCQYDGSSHTLNKHSSRESADRGSRRYDGTPDPDRIACLKIVFEEGEGL